MQELFQCSSWISESNYNWFVWSFVVLKVELMEVWYYRVPPPGGGRSGVGSKWTLGSAAV